MSRFINVLVTTTNTLDGFTIKEYVKPLSTHVVAGTNFFSDFFASFSDMFGGRSSTYQRQLSSLYLEATELLKQSAIDLGANAVIGLSVDLDEISGKGKSMFMITAIGTAVVVERQSSFQDSKSEENTSILSINKMLELREKKRIVKLAKDKKLIKTDDFGKMYFIDEMDDIWSFITANAVHEVASDIIDIPMSTFYYPRLLSYFYSLEKSFYIDMLFDKVMKKSLNETVLRLMRDLKIFEPKRLIEFFQSDVQDKKKVALELVIIDKDIYTKEDIAVFENLIKVIKESFHEVVDYSTKKGFLSKGKEVWTCSCGNSNDTDTEYCTISTCRKDKYGFIIDEVSPLKAIKILEDNIDIIKYIIP